MYFSQLCLAIGTVAGTYALPPTLRPSYAVKERHAVPLDWTEVGPAAKKDTIHLQIGVKQRNEGVVEQHLIEVSDPNHARYGQHLTAAEINEITSPSEESVELVKAWLAEHDVSDHVSSPAKDWIHIVIPIEKAEQLLQTSYSTFKHGDGTTISRAPEWSLPLHLHEHIDVVQPTTSFFRPTAQADAFHPVAGGQTWSMEWWEQQGKQLYNTYDASASDSCSVSSLCNISFTTSDCIRCLYGTIDYKPKATDKNKMGICNYLNETNKRSDVSKFLKNFRPAAAAAAYEFEIEIIAHAHNDQGPYTPAQIQAGQNIEGNLDAELALSITWPTNLTAFSTGGEPPFIKDRATQTDTNEPYLTFLNYALAQDDLPQVISTSYGDDEQTVPYSYAKRVCADYAKLGARGISIFFSSGDSGVGTVGTCVSNTVKGKKMFLPEFPTSCPWVTSVGGTQAFKPEVAVSRFASGAGFSNYFTAPKYQKSTVDAYIASLNGLYDGLYNKTGRGYPDVAAQGNHDVIVWAGNITTIGGTSASSPTFASVISLVNDALLAKGKSPLGFLNPWLYGGAYKALTDITGGSSYGCHTSGFPAQAGWDAVTGFGTPNFEKLVAEAMKK